MILIRRVKTAWHLLRAGRVRSFVKALNHRIRALRGSRLWVSRRVWSTAQAGELQFHVENASRLAQQFERHNADMLAKFGFKVLDFAGRTIVDIGAGSRLRTRWFKDARIFVIEPLADRYIRDVPCCDLPAADRVYAVPAEEFVSGLVGVADLVISINALDHCRDFGAVIKNIVLYADPNALIFLSFDSHEIAGASGFMGGFVIDQERG